MNTDIFRCIRIGRPESHRWVIFIPYRCPMEIAPCISPESVYGKILIGSIIYISQSKPAIIISIEGKTISFNIPSYVEFCSWITSYANSYISIVMEKYIHMTTVTRSTWRSWIRPKSESITIWSCHIVE